MVNSPSRRTTAQTGENDDIAQADKILIRTWLHNRPPTTVRAYKSDIAAFMKFTGKSMAEIGLADLQTWYDSMPAAPSDATKRRRIAAVKSLLTHGHRIGFLSEDAGIAFRMERGRDNFADRILSREQVKQIISDEADPRRNAFLSLLYGTGLRISEACALCWGDVSQRQSGGVATVFGKGGKTRRVQIAPSLLRRLVALRQDARADAPVVPGHDGGALHVRAAHRIVKRAAGRAGLPSASAHWLRHAFASHALEAGQPVSWVQTQLGHSSLATTTRYSHVTEDCGGADLLSWE